MRDASPVHFEPLERPVTSRYSTIHTGSNCVAMSGNDVECIKLFSAVGLFQYLVNIHFQIGVESLEQIFKKQRKQLSGAISLSS